MSHRLFTVNFRPRLPPVTRPRLGLDSCRSFLGSRPGLKDQRVCSSTSLRLHRTTESMIISLSALIILQVLHPRRRPHASLRQIIVRNDQNCLCSPPFNLMALEESTYPCSITSPSQVSADSGPYAQLAAASVYRPAIGVAVAEGIDTH